MGVKEVTKVTEVRGGAHLGAREGNVGESFMGA